MRTNRPISHGTGRHIFGRLHSRVAKLTVIGIMVASVGCGSVLRVVRTQPPAPPGPALERLPGIPFYAVGYQCLHTTVWLQPIYGVTLVVTGSDNKFIPPVTKFFGRKEFEDPKTQALLTIIKVASQSPVGDYKPIRDAFTDLGGVDPLAFDTTKILVKGSLESQEVLLASNSVAPDRYVDANAVFYYNVNKPISGTANAEIDLSNEGILNKASGQVEDKTLETVLSALPISDLIKGAAGFSAQGLDLTPPPPGAPVTYKLDLQIQTKIYKHTHSKVDSAAKPPCPATAALVGADGSTDFNFTVEDATTPPPAAPAKPAPASEKSKSGGATK